MPDFRRPTLHRYEDPLERIWIDCAERVGFRIERTPDAYASTDGRGTILIGTRETLDPDDSLAQMILHELCHVLVEGEEAEQLVDWGLDNTSNRHLWREHACLRLQAHLAGRVGLRNFFAPTTDFRVTFWNALPEDPFAAAGAGGRREPSCVAARLGVWRATQPRWATPLTNALDASAEIASALQCSGAGTANSADQDLPSLWTTVRPRPARHPSGHAPVAEHFGGSRCQGCAWAFRFRGSLRCRHAPDRRLDDESPACQRYEPAEELDCRACGACCREAYQAVDVSPGERMVRSRRDLIVEDRGRLKVRRAGERCAALGGGDTPTARYVCEIYPDRPRTCREFTRGSANCLDARRRVGLSL